jgi:hypothetical protein
MGGGDKSGPDAACFHPVSCVVHHFNLNALNLEAVGLRARLWAGVLTENSCCGQWLRKVGLSRRSDIGGRKTGKKTEIR